MKTFTDTTGRTWTIALTVDAAKRVKGLLDVNLLELDAGDPPLLTRLGTDVILLCDVIFALVKPQADANGVTDEEFGAALGGEAILAAQTALYEELVDFFRGAGRADLAKAVGEGDQGGSLNAADDRHGHRADRDADRRAGPRSSDRHDAWRVVYELAGVCGVDPGPLTLRELLWMAEARGSAWIKDILPNR